MLTSTWSTRWRFFREKNRAKKASKIRFDPFHARFMEKQQDRKRESNFSLFFLDPPPLSPPPLPLRCLNVSFGNANGKGLLKYGRMKNENRKNPKSQGLFRYFSLSLTLFLSLIFFRQSTREREEGFGKRVEQGRGIQVITRRLAQTRLKSPKPLK